MRLDIFKCHGITRDPGSKDYMMILEDGNLRDYVANSKDYIPYDEKTFILYQIMKGLKCIHDAGKVHKDFHSGNILCDNVFIDIVTSISDLGLCRPCRPATEQSKDGKVYGVLPYVAPEVLRGKQYSPAADIYSFGIVMNEFLSEEYPFGDVPHDYALARDIFDGVRPKISEHVPKFLAEVIIKCWNTEAEDRPTAKELFHVFGKWVKR